MFSLLLSKKARVLEAWPYSSPPTIQPFQFEKLDAFGWRQWMDQNWTYSLVLTVIYILLIPQAQKWMSGQSPFLCNRTILVWNLALAGFSICGFLRTAPELLQVLSGPDGLYRSVCVRDIFNESSTFWSWLFTWSKLVELGNTGWLILRKKEVSFPHRFHQVTSLVFAWATYPDWEPIQRCFWVMHMFVRSWLYGYHALRVMGVPLPRRVTRAVRVIQVGEMVVGFGLNWYVMRIIDRDENCARSEGRYYLWLYGTSLVTYACHNRIQVINRRNRRDYFWWRPRAPVGA